MFVRTASERDLDAVRALLVETWHATYDAIYGAERVTEITDDWHSIAALKARLTRPNSEFLVADDGKSIGGMAFAAADETARSVMLHQLYVLPGLQGHGIGGDAARRDPRDCFPDAETVRLEVEEANAAAIAFYRGLRLRAMPGAPANCGARAIRHSGTDLGEAAWRHELMRSSAMDDGPLAFARRASTTCRRIVALLAADALGGHGDTTAPDACRTMSRRFADRRQPERHALCRRARRRGRRHLPDHADHLAARARQHEHDDRGRADACRHARQGDRRAMMRFAIEQARAAGARSCS